MVLRHAAAPAVPTLKGARILILEAPYYAEITEKLAGGALAVIGEAGGLVARVAVPGALELPQALGAFIDADRIGRRAGDRKQFDGCLVLGCVIRGETTHYDTVVNESNRGLMDLAVKHGVPLGNAILTVETEAQALARCEGGAANKGGDAARAALALIELEQQLGVAT